MLSLSSKSAHLYYPPAAAWLQAPELASGQCQTCCVKPKIYTSRTFCTDLMATGPAALHEQSATEQSSWAEQKPEPEESGSAQPRRTVLCMLSMDPQCTHILYSVKNGYKRDLLIMFFCSFLSRTDVKNTMVRRSLRTPMINLMSLILICQSPLKNKQTNKKDVCSHFHSLTLWHADWH